MPSNGYEHESFIIEKVENGFIIHNGRDKFVFITLKQALQFIEKAFKE